MPKVEAKKEEPKMVTSKWILATKRTWNGTHNVSICGKCDAEFETLYCDVTKWKFCPVCGIYKDGYTSDRV